MPFTEPSHPLPSPFAALRSVDRPFGVIGSGIGDKYAALNEKAALIRDAGLETNTGIVFGDSFLRQICSAAGVSLDTQASHDVSSLLPRLRLALELSEEFQREIRTICESPPPGQAFAVRSSAFGDAKGNGIYKSSYCAARVEPLTDAFCEVLASYFSADAVAFRQRARLPCGFAIGIEPLIGDEIISDDSDVSQQSCPVAPLISGYGYAIRGGASNFVVGFGLADQTVTYATRVTRVSQQHLEEAGSDEAQEVVYHQLRSAREPARVFSAGDSSISTIAAFIDTLNEMSFRPMLASLEQLAKSCDRPQYFEYAVVRGSSGGDYRFFITQIADVEMQCADVCLPLEKDDCFSWGHTTNASGVTHVSTVLELKNREAVAALANYNGNHSGYALLIDSSLLKCTARGGGMLLNFGSFSNAAAIIVSVGDDHRRPLLSHFDGATRQSNIFLLERTGDLRYDRLAKCSGYTHKEVAPGLSCHEAQLTIVANRAGPPSTHGWAAIIDDLQKQTP